MCARTRSRRSWFRNAWRTNDEGLLLCLALLCLDDGEHRCEKMKRQRPSRVQFAQYGCYDVRSVDEDGAPVQNAIRAEIIFLAGITRMHSLRDGAPVHARDADCEQVCASYPDVLFDIEMSFTSIMHFIFYNINSAFRKKYVECVANATPKMIITFAKSNDLGPDANVHCIACAVVRSVFRAMVRWKLLVVGW